MEAISSERLTQSSPSLRRPSCWVRALSAKASAARWLCSAWLRRQSVPPEIQPWKNLALRCPSPIKRMLLAQKSRTARVFSSPSSAKSIPLL